ncbi:hypothetical protein HNO88_002974 [Novosphingobium chloroacetimidivorans]|uniref:Uncharacterized protein n=1 Tax=Novosphingobium chloroacetimidivorans TaxID=1428314 RepID=A0A7W7KBA2_9SPHN|nr:hypothetical protein [Novosphingobium chloroacetimidivorans]MBB4859645.1 hypothetical protein [Novosphingobium chloroacetimidivorans]
MTGGKSALERAKRAQRDERRRVRDLVERDRADTAREEMRQAAELEVREGVFVNLDDTVVAPTPEWMSKGPTRKFTPKAPDGTARSVSSVRRVLTPVIIALWTSDKLTLRQASACTLYRDTWERTGLEGRCSSSQYSLTATIHGSPVGGRIPMTEWEAHARGLLRSARLSIPAHLRNFFDAVVVSDLPLRRAGRFTRCRNGRELPLLRQAAEALADHFESVGQDLTSEGVNDVG